MVRIPAPVMHVMWWGWADLGSCFLEGRARRDCRVRFLFVDKAALCRAGFRRLRLAALSQGRLWPDSRGGCLQMIFVIPFQPCDF